MKDVDLKKKKRNLTKQCSMFGMASVDLAGSVICFLIKGEHAAVMMRGGRSMEDKFVIW